MESKQKTIESVVKRFKIIYDVKAVPNGLNVERLSKLGDAGWVFYDSEKGNRPKIVETGLGNQEIEATIRFVDTKGSTVDYATFEAKLIEEDYWDKELYKCKNSPLTYFKEYGCLQATTTFEEETNFLKENNLLHTSTNSDEASEEYKAMRESYTKFENSITVDALKALKVKMDIIREAFEKECEAKVATVREKLGTTIQDDKLFREKIISAICKIKPKDVKTEGASKSLVKGRWDKPVLRQTDTHILCDILLNN